MTDGQFCLERCDLPRSRNIDSEFKQIFREVLSDWRHHLFQFPHDTFTVYNVMRLSFLSLRILIQFHPERFFADSSPYFSVNRLNHDSVSIVVKPAQILVFD